MRLLVTGGAGFIGSNVVRELGWSPQVPLREGVADTVAWYREHRGWWEPLLATAPFDEHAWADCGPAPR